MPWGRGEVGGKKRLNDGADFNRKTVTSHGRKKKNQDVDLRKLICCSDQKLRHRKRILKLKKTYQN